MIGKSCKFFILAFCSLLFVQVKAQELLNYPLDTINGEEVYRYHVEKSIGLYRIGVNFDVSQNDIIRLNPQLRERGVHYDELLFIPTKRKVEERKAEEKKEVAVEKPEDRIEKQAKFERPEGKPVVEEKVEVLPIAQAPEVLKEPEVKEEPQVTEEPVTVIDSIAAVVDSLSLEPEVLDSVVDGKRVIEYALMLPFESQQTKRSVNAVRMLEFYQGALLALFDLQNDSIMYRLRVYDVERNEQRIKALCDSTELDRIQGVLGLVFPNQIDVMAKWCEQHNVPLLLPFSDNIVLRKHPQVLQFNSTDSQEADSLCEWMAAHDSLIHCVAIEVKEADYTAPIRELRKAMTAHGIAYTNVPMHNLMNDSVAYALNPEKENLIIVHSDRYQHVRVLLPHLLKLQEQGFRLRLVSQYSWQKENLPLPQVYTSVFTSDMAREEYDMLWSQLYVNEHSGDTPRYDLLGYDLMHALVEKINGQDTYFGLQSIIRWQQDGNGGWQNAEVTVIEK